MSMDWLVEAKEAANDQSFGMMALEQLHQG
jgi:hypothetical protein